jgi:hypothetical protein
MTAGPPHDQPGQDPSQRPPQPSPQQPSPQQPSPQQPPTQHQPTQQPSYQPPGYQQQQSQFQPPPGGYQPQAPRAQHSQQWPPAQQYGTPSYPPAPQYAPPQHEMAGAGDKGFFGSLFDYSFTSFVTPKLVKVVYILATVVIGLAYLGFVISAFAANGGVGVFALVFGGIGAIFYLGFIRLTLELAHAVVRMSQDINQRLPAK